MNQRISLFSRSASLNSYGEQSDSFTSSGSVFASVKHKATSEKFDSGQHRIIHKATAIARHCSIGAGDEVEYSGYRWDVEGVRRSHRAGNIKIELNRLYKLAAGFYLQPNGINFYLTPSGNKYLQP